MLLETSDQSDSSGVIAFSQLGPLSERGGLEGLPCRGSRDPYPSLFFFYSCGSYNPSQVAWALPRIEGIVGSSHGGWDRVAVWGCGQVGLGVGPGTWDGVKRPLLRLVGRFFLRQSFFSNARHRRGS